MRIVVTGGDGFIARNLRLRLRELGHADVVSLTRASDATTRTAALTNADFVFHLAGVNRPTDVREFDEGNAGLTAAICEALSSTGRPIPLAFSSSTQVLLDNPYGRSKRAGEHEVERYGRTAGAPVFVLRLPNVFGKWARPNYNSAVATFCYNIARGIPITVNDASAPLTLIHVDDVVETLIRLLDAPAHTTGFLDVGPIYETTVGDVAATLARFAESRHTLAIPAVGAGLTRALYATYVSYLPPEEFSYGLKRHSDPRGVFVEILKTRDAGQFSYFTAPPGITRGEHYHHSKTEKFLVVKGRARFGFRHLITNEIRDVVVEGAEPRVVETAPGWVHNITNIGDDEMIVLLWANETFDPQRPDTVAAKVAL